jgi:hypothetical protein
MPKVKRQKKGQKAPSERLTQKQQMLLEYMLNPENRHKPVTQICKDLGISRKMWYEAMERPRFQTLYQEQSVAMTKHAVGPVINSVIKEATRGSLGHQKLVLEMAGVYTPKQQLEHSGPAGGPIKSEATTKHDLSKLSTEELKQLAAILQRSTTS